MARRRRIHVPVGAMLFLGGLVALTAIFFHDWKVAQTRPIVARELASDQPAPPQPLEEESMPSSEAPAAPIEALSEAPENTPKGDPWAEEKTRLKERERKRNNGFVQVNPRIILDGEAFAFVGKDLFGDRPFFPEIRPAFPEMHAFAAAGRIDPQAMAEELFASAGARRIAAEVQTAFFSSIPDSRHFVSSFDVAPGDGRLIVNVRNSFRDLAADSQRSIMEAVAGVWRGAKYTTHHQCSKAVEFRSWDGWKETLEP